MPTLADLCCSVIKLDNSDILTAHNYIESIPYISRFYEFLDMLEDIGVKKAFTIHPSFVSKVIAPSVAAVLGRDIPEEETEMRRFVVTSDKFAQKTTQKRTVSYFSARNATVSFDGETATFTLPKPIEK